MTVGAVTTNALAETKVNAPTPNATAHKMTSLEAFGITPSSAGTGLAGYPGRIVTNRGSFRLEASRRGTLCQKSCAVGVVLNAVQDARLRNCPHLVIPE